MTAVALVLHIERFASFGSFQIGRASNRTKGNAGQHA